MPLTAFYAIDQTGLPEQHWDLADTFAQLHALSTSGTEGVARITVADLLLALDALGALESRPDLERHRNAAARIRAAIASSVGVSH